jgi:hypothetical protein
MNERFSVNCQIFSCDEYDKTGYEGVCSEVDIQRVVGGVYEFLKTPDTSISGLPRRLGLSLNVTRFQQKYNPDRGASERWTDLNDGDVRRVVRKSGGTVVNGVRIDKIHGPGFSKQVVVSSPHRQRVEIDLTVKQSDFKKGVVISLLGRKVKDLGEGVLEGLIDRDLEPRLWHYRVNSTRELEEVDGQWRIADRLSK